MSGETLRASNEEITAAAARLDGIGFAYECPAVSTSGCGPEATGHVELASVLAQFGEHATVVINALVSDVGRRAEALRDAARMYCVADDQAATDLGSFSLPSFDPHVDLPS